MEWYQSHRRRLYLLHPGAGPSFSKEARMTCTCHHFTDGEIEVVEAMLRDARGVGHEKTWDL